MMNVSPPSPQSSYRLPRSGLPTRWVLAASCAVILIRSTSGCLSVPDYGIGTPCDERKACRNPLVCSEGHCVLAPNNTSTLATYASSPTSEAGGAVALSAGGAAALSALETVASRAGELTDFHSTSTGQGSSNSVARAASTLAASTFGGARSSTGAVAASHAGATGVSATGVGADRGAGGLSNTSGPVDAPDARGTAGMAGHVSVIAEKGHTCAQDSECRSGHCVDGVCCDTACTEQCKACNLEEHLGQCTIQSSGQPIGKRAPCTNAGSVCGGSCGGEQSCSYPDGTKSCDESSRCVTRFTRLDRMTCDGLGYCATAVTSDCF